MRADHRRAARSTPAMNTHGNGDHCFGNELLPTASPIYAPARGRATRCARRRRAPSHALFNELDLGPEFDAFAQRAHAAVRLRRASSCACRRRRSRARLDLQVGDRNVHAASSSARRTPRGDSIVHVPDAGVGVHRRHPVHRGHADHVGGPGLELARRPATGSSSSAPRVIVPGHGPVTDDVRRARRAALPDATCATRRARASTPAWTPRPPPTTSTSRTSATGATPSGSRPTSPTLYREFDPALPRRSPAGAVRADGAAGAHAISTRDDG